MTIKFKKTVDKEVRYILLDQLKEYETATAMTISEREELHKWVADGNSPYDNPYLYSTESGCPMDFIEAGRVEEDLMEQALATKNYPDKSLDNSSLPEYSQELEYPF